MPKNVRSLDEYRKKSQPQGSRRDRRPDAVHRYEREPYERDVSTDEGMRRPFLSYDHSAEIYRPQRTTKTRRSGRGQREQRVTASPYAGSVADPRDRRKSGSSSSHRRARPAKQSKTERKVKVTRYFQQPSETFKRNLRMLGIFMVFAICVLGTMRLDSTINQKQYQNNTMQKELNALRNQTQELTVRLEENNSSKNIEQIAKDQLGMIYPRPDQIVYIRSDR